MLNVENLSVYFAARAVLANVSFRLGTGERVAVVGPNGAGKSTLLRCCAGLLTQDEGKISMPNRCTVGYLAQEVSFPEGRSVFDEVMTVYAEAEAALVEMRGLEHDMAETDHGTPEFDRIAHRYDFLQQEVIRLDAYTAEAKAGRVLAGLGFAHADLARPCPEFSGGWQMRIELAKVLLRAPDVLLLDEPTNYLDIETMLWLEHYILSLPSSVMFVSHERAFMDRLATRVFEVTDGRFAIYKGNYTRYLDERGLRREQQQQTYDNQQAKIKHIEDYAARFRVTARRASQVQSRLKVLDRMEMVDAPPPDAKTIHFRFPPAPPSNRIVLKLEEMAKSYGEHRVLEGVDLTIERGDKIALVGLNGAGKSTLIKVLAGLEKATGGNVKIGERTEIAYFAQYQFDDLTPTNSVYDEIAINTMAGQGNIVRDVAGAFLFRGDDVDKPVNVLSGGEKTRLRLAKMLLGGGNCLLLDEPTNHLDIAARATLEEALRQYTGAFVLVSHDRVFVDNVATRIFEVADGGVRQFNGTYADYVEKLESEAAARDGEALGDAPGSTAKEWGASPVPVAPDLPTAKLGKKKNKKGGGGAAATAVAAAPPASPEMSPRDARRKLKTLREESARLEDDIRRTEEEQQRLTDRMADPAVYKDGGEMARLKRRHDELAATLEAQLEKWSAAGEEIERLAELEAL